MSIRKTATFTFVAACVLLPQPIHARIVNSINFLGVNQRYDSEAEYRLLEFGRAIVEARRDVTDLSLAVKDAYGASLLGEVEASTTRLAKSKDNSVTARDSWVRVAKLAGELSTWLDGNLRPEYAKAFCEIAEGDSEFHGYLSHQRASADYMRWAFADIQSACEQHEYKQDAIIAVFEQLEMQALENAAGIKGFMTAMEKAEEDPSFRERGLYGYIFESLAIRAEKPEIFTKDEVFFTGVNRFEILYEALEQFSRETHKMVPQTHDQEFQTFDLKYTPAPKDR